MAITQFPAPAGQKEKRVDLITSTGTWTAPAGVTYAIATLIGGGGAGGGGGAFTENRGTAGGSTSAFGFTHPGGSGGQRMNTNYNILAEASQGNTGLGGGSSLLGGNSQMCGFVGHDSNPKIVGSAVTPGTGYTITIGAGGTVSNGGAGGSGYVSIEYWIG